MHSIFSRYFPTPRYLAMSSCALDISDHTIKYGELTSDHGGLQIGAYGSVLIPNGVVVSGKIHDDAVIVDLLKKIKEKEKLHFVRVGLPEEQMYLFSLALPASGIKNITEAILLQLEEHIPLAASDAFFDYEIVYSDESNMIVSVAAIARTTIEGYLSVFERAGLTPISFELEAESIARALIKKDSTETVMIVDFREMRTVISIVSRGNVIFTSTLDLGGLMLTEMISKNFSISLEEAEKIKRNYGVQNGKKDEEVFSVVLSGLSVLRDEINKYFIYWGTHADELNKKRAPISKIILCGGASNILGLAEYLSVSMKTKVEYGNAWLNISDMSDDVPEMSFAESLAYVTVLGLALADYIYD